MSTKVIAIRADANEKIASGHIMRCLSVAVKLRKAGSEVLFIVSDSFGQDLVEAKGFESICLNNDYREKSSEVQALANIIEERNIALMLVDSYEIDYNYMSMLSQYVKLAYIDDMKVEQYPVDMLVNYTIGTRVEEYLDMGYPREQLMIGNEYVPLRKEFSGKGIDIKETVDSVFITTGGADEYDMVRALIDELGKSSLSNMKKHIVVGKFYKHYDELLSLSEADDTLAVYRNVSNICDIMKKCDIAVSAGGTTLAELCACGVPTVCFSVADNQLFGTRAYAAKGIMEYAGDVRDGKEKLISGIVNSLENIANDHDKRRFMGSRAKETIDGYGAKRIAEGLIFLTK